MVSWDGIGGGWGAVFVIAAVVIGAGIVWVTVHPVRSTPPCGRRDTARTSALVASRHRDASREVDGHNERSVRICSCSLKTCIIEADPDLNPEKPPCRSAPGDRQA